MTASFQSLVDNTRKRIEIANTEVGLRRVASHLERRNARRQVSSGDEVAAADAHVGDRHVRRDITRLVLQMRHHRSNSWIIERGRRLVAGEQIVSTKIMLPKRRGHRTNDCRVLHDSSRSRHELAEVDARHRCRNRAEWSANFLVGLGFGVECFEVARATIEPNKNARLGPCGGRRGGSPRAVVPQPKPEGGKSANLQKISSRQPPGGWLRANCSS